MAYGLLFEELKNDCDYMKRILCSVIVMFLVRKQNLAGPKFVYEWEMETVMTRSLIAQDSLIKTGSRILIPQ
jgi:hypothetical protein